MSVTDSTGCASVYLARSPYDYKDYDTKGGGTPSIPLARVLLPELVVTESIVSLNGKELSIKTILQLSQLCLAFLNETYAAYDRRDYPAFDGQFHNDSCEGYTLMLLSYIQSNSIERLDLSRAKQALEDVTTQLDVTSKRRPYVAFFNKTMQNLTVSEPLANLIRCRLLTSVRDIFRNEKGYLAEKTSPSLLEKYGEIKGIRLDSKYCKKIVEAVQVALSHSLVVYLREQTVHLPEERRGIISEKLGEEFQKTNKNGLVYTPLFYRASLVIERLMQQGALIALAQMTLPDEKFNPLFYRGSVELSSDEMGRLPDGTPVVLLEGFHDVKTQREELRNLVQEIGLKAIVLAAASVEPQYGDLKIKFETEEIQFHTAEAARYKSIYAIVHFSLTTVGLLRA